MAKGRKKHIHGIRVSAGNHSLIPGLMGELERMIPVLRPELTGIKPTRIEARENITDHRKPVDIVWEMKGETSTGFRLKAVTNKAKQTVFFMGGKRHRDRLKGKIEQFLLTDKNKKKSKTKKAVKDEIQLPIPTMNKGEEMTTEASAVSVPSNEVVATMVTEFLTKHPRLSLKDVGDMIGTSDSTVSNWSKARTSPREDLWGEFLKLREQDEELARFASKKKRKTTGVTVGKKRKTNGSTEKSRLEEAKRVVAGWDIPPSEEVNHKAIATNIAAADYVKQMVRKGEQVTIEELAVYTDVGTGSVKNWLNEVNIPTGEKVQKLFDLYRYCCKHGRPRSRADVEEQALPEAKSFIKKAAPAEEVGAAPTALPPAPQIEEKALQTPSDRAKVLSIVHERNRAVLDTVIDLPAEMAMNVLSMAWTAMKAVKDNG